VDVTPCDHAPGGRISRVPEDPRKQLLPDDVQDPGAAAQVTIQPVERWGGRGDPLLRHPHPRRGDGVPLSSTTERAAFLGKAIQGQRDVDSLRIPDPEEKVPFVMEAIRILRKPSKGKCRSSAFRAPPSPRFLHRRGGTLEELHPAEKLMYQAPEVYRSLMEKITKTVTAYLNAQIAAGAQAVQIFDTWRES